MTDTNPPTGADARISEARLDELADLSAPARAAVPELVAEVRRLRAVVAEADQATADAMLHNDATCEAVAERNRLAVENAELRARADRADRGARELLHALSLAVTTIRAAWVEADRVGPEEGIAVLEELVHATAADLPDLPQYDGALAVFDAEYAVADRSADAKRLRARLAKEA